MLNMKVKQVIPPIVEAMLPRFSDPSLGLIITLDLRDTDFDTEKHTRTECSFIFRRPDNYTLVLAKYKFNSFANPKYNPFYKVVYFEKYSNHDSCWKDDGLFVLNEHWNKVNKYFNKHPSEISSFYSFSIFTPIQYIKFEKIEPVKQSDGCIKGYNVKVTEVKS